MYKIITKSKRAEKQYYDVLYSRDDIPDKINRIMDNPRKELGAHKLKGKLKGLWGCHLGSDIILIYRINDETKEIVVYSAGSHKAYR